MAYIPTFPRHSTIGIRFLEGNVSMDEGEKTYKTYFFAGYPIISIQFLKGTYIWNGQKNLSGILRLPRRQGPSTSSFHNRQPRLPWERQAYRSDFTYVVLSPLSLDFYHTNTGIQTNWWDDRRFMVGMQVFLVDHVQSTQWSWIKSSMSNRSSKSRQAPPSPLGCIRKSARHLLYPAPKNREATNHGVKLAKNIVVRYFFRIQLHEHEQYMITSFGCLPARYTYNPLTASMAWLSLSGWPLSKQKTVGAVPVLDTDAGRAINTRCLLFSNFTLACDPCLEGSPLPGAKGSRQTQKHICSVFFYQNSFKDLPECGI